jgi:hypothetical protein
MTGGHLAAGIVTVVGSLVAVGLWIWNTRHESQEIAEILGEAKPAGEPNSVALELARENCDLRLERSELLTRVEDQAREIAQLREERNGQAEEIQRLRGMIARPAFDPAL